MKIVVDPRFSITTRSNTVAVIVDRLPRRDEPCDERHVAYLHHENIIELIARGEKMPEG